MSRIKEIHNKLLAIKKSCKAFWANLLQSSVLTLQVYLTALKSTV